jgi:hypothetical protein
MMNLQVFTAASMKISAFWDVARCRLVETNRRFRSAYCLHNNRSDIIPEGIFI